MIVVIISLRPRVIFMMPGSKPQMPPTMRPAMRPAAMATGPVSPSPRMTVAQAQAPMMNWPSPPRLKTPHL